MCNFVMYCTAQNMTRNQSHMVLIPYWSLGGRDDVNKPALLAPRQLYGWLLYFLHQCMPGSSSWWPLQYHAYIKGILPKGPYLPCVSMAGRALWAGYHRHVQWQKSKISVQYHDQQKYIPLIFFTYHIKTIRTNILFHTCCKVCLYIIKWK